MERKICVVCRKEFEPKEKRERAKTWGLCCGKRCGAILGWRERERIRVVDRFLEKILIGDGCWEWIGVKSHGYAVINENHPPYRNIKAGRISYEAFVGPIPQAMEMCHKCDNPGCVRFSHLFPGTHAENMNDSKRKGRMDDRRGERNPGAKLDRPAVLQIRKQLAEGLANKKIAEQFGVSSALIANIKSRGKWKHV